MTNPPFYDSAASMAQSAKQKSRPPNSSCTGAPVEMITPGGEVAFVCRLISESLLSTIKHRIQWFSSMLGKLSSVASVIEYLKDQGCTNYAVTEFIQGQKTRRWCVAWSCMGFRPTLAVARGISGVSGIEKKFLPASTEFEFDIEGTADGVATRIDEEVGKLDLQWRFQQSRRMGILLSQGGGVVSHPGDVWSRKARRNKQILKQKQDQEQKQKQKQNEDEEMKDRDDDLSDEVDEGDEEEPEPGLVAKISVLAGGVGPKNAAVARVQIRWLQGWEPVVFESFCGWLKRKLEARR
jgi:23S rRNA (adenine1618-N6)-methyltransferase